MSQLDQHHILIVDDSQTIRNSISKYLGENYVVLHAKDGEQAWQLIKSNSSIALVFADLHMPVMNGMALLNRIRGSKNNRVSDLPVIMITGHEDAEAAKRASYNMGASAFISKPFSELDIISQVESFVKFKQTIEVLEQNLTKDELTGFYNQNGFKQIGDQALAGAYRHDYDLSLLSLQLVNVEDILKNYGKKITSQVISAVANTLKKSLRKEESLAHMGMGHFALLMPLTKAFRAQIVAQRFQQAVSAMAFKIGQQALRVDLASGINSTEDYSGETSFVELLEHTDTAMEQSLNSEGHKIFRYDAALGELFSTTLTERRAVDLINQSSPALSVSGSAAASSATASSTTASSTTERADLDDFPMHNTTAFGKYMSMIMNREFSKIPEQDIKLLVKPLQAFLMFAEKHKLEEMAAESC